MITEALEISKCNDFIFLLPVAYAEKGVFGNTKLRSCHIVFIRVNLTIKFFIHFYFSYN